MATVHEPSRVPGYWTVVRTEDVADQPEPPKPAAKPPAKPARGDRGRFVRKPEGDPS